MKRRVLSTAMMSLILTFALTQSINAAAAGKVGYIDLSRLFDDYQKTKDYDVVLQGKYNEYEKQRGEKIQKLQSDNEKLALLKDEEKKKLEGQIEIQKNEVQGFDQQMRTDLTKQRDEKIREILLEIEGVVKDYATKGNYTMILNDRVLIYGEPTGDVTEDILKIMNENYAKTKPAAPAEKIEKKVK